MYIFVLVIDSVFLHITQISTPASFQLCYESSGKALCDGPIPHPEESYRVHESLSGIRCINSSLHQQWVRRTDDTKKERMQERKESPQFSPHLCIPAVLNAVMWWYVRNSFRQHCTTADCLCSSHYIHSLLAARNRMTNEGPCPLGVARAIYCREGTRRHQHRTGISTLLTAVLVMQPAFSIRFPTHTSSRVGQSALFTSGD
jgi:hypothetical protein